MKKPSFRTLNIWLFCLLFLSVLIRMFMSYQSAIEFEEDFSAYNKNKNTVIFAAYDADGRIPDYVVTYLKALKEIAPNIIYVTDNGIRRADINKLSGLVTHLIAKRHGEYDFGSYKRGYKWLKANNLLSATDKLILANDSALLVADGLQLVMQSMPQEADFYGITANQDGTYHLQSYFLIFKPTVYNHQGFADYLENIRPQKDGLTVAARYEIPLTPYLHGLGFKSATYIAYEALSYLPLNDKNCYPLTMLSRYHTPLLKMRTFTNRLNVQESRRLVFRWLKKNAPQSYQDLIKHLKHINSPYLKENK